MEAWRGFVRNRAAVFETHDGDGANRPVPRKALRKLERLQSILKMSLREAVIREKKDFL